MCECGEMEEADSRSLESLDGGRGQEWEARRGNGQKLIRGACSRSSGFASHRSLPSGRSLIHHERKTSSTNLPNDRGHPTRFRTAMLSVRTGRRTNQKGVSTVSSSTKHSIGSNLVAGGYLQVGISFSPPWLSVSKSRESALSRRARLQKCCWTSCFLIS